MHASPNNRCPAFWALGFAISLVWTGSVLAQQSEPIKLAPPKSQAPSAAPTALIDASGRRLERQPGYKTGPAGRSLMTINSIGASGIEVDRLQAMTPDSAGILTAETGGLGVDIWRSTPLSTAIKILTELPVRIGSSTLSGLVRRIMLTAADPPKGQSDGEQLAVIRLQRLAAMADYPAALDLLSVMPRQGRGEGLLRAEAELRFLSGDHIAACGLVSAEVLRSQVDFWQKAMVFCQILSGDLGKAELGLTLLREVGSNDPEFFALAGAMVADVPYQNADLSQSAPLILAMLLKVKFSVKLATLVDMPPGGLRVVALAENQPIGLRLLAIEQMARLGMFSDAALGQVYVKTIEKLPQLAAEAAGAPLSEPEGRAIERARLFASARRSSIPVAKAEAASQAFKLAASDGNVAGTARLFRAELAQIPVSTEMLWFAADAFRAAVASDEQERGNAWIAMLRRSAAMSDEKNAALETLLTLASILSDDEKIKGDLPVSSPDDASRTVLIYALRDGLGQRMPPKRWMSLLDQVSSAVAKPMPPAHLWFALKALNASAKEEVVSGMAKPASVAIAAMDTPSSATTLSVQQLAAPTAGTRSDIAGKAARVLLFTWAMGSGEPGAQNPIVLAEVIHGLMTLGLPAEARRLAIEAALGAGL